MKTIRLASMIHKIFVIVIAKIEISTAKSQ